MAADNLTIYNRDLALVSENRSLDLQSGENKIDLVNVAANIIPQSVVLHSPQNFQILEQNFDYDLLDYPSLLKKYINREVEVLYEHGGSEKATVLANNDGVILKYANRIEHGLPAKARLSFPEIPANLRERPTLSVLLNSPEAQKAEVELSYLTQGFSWKADYVANLSKEDTLDLAGWVTLDNKSGKDFEAARVQLVAGEVNRAPEEYQYGARRDRLGMAAAPMAEAALEVSEEALFEYHLYSLGRPATVLNNQTKQVALLDEAKIPLQRQYDFTRSVSQQDDKEKAQAQVYLKFENKNMALPAGVVRVYQQDSSGQKQFIGEDRIKHTAKNEDVRLKLGEAFDVRAEYEQLDWKRLDYGVSRRETYELTNQITLFNAKDQAITADVREILSPEWEMREESSPHEKENSTTARWKIEVPAQGKAVLKYTVRVKF